MGALHGCKRKVEPGLVPFGGKRCRLKYTPTKTPRTANPMNHQTQTDKGLMVFSVGGSGGSVGVGGRSNPVSLGDA